VPTGVREGPVRGVLVAVLGATFALSAWPAGAASTSTPAPRASSRPVYVIDHGWHVGLTVRTEAVSRDAWPEVEHVARFRHVEVGWGDGEYYPAVRPTPWLAMRAAFASTTSVLHVAAFDEPVQAFFGRASVVEVRLSPRGFEALSRFVHDSYATDAVGHPVIVAPGLYGAGAFYRAKGTYRWFNNSNQWAAQALRVAGCPVSSALALHASSVLSQASRFGRAPVGLEGGAALREADVPPDCP
jgi:uncharacterized protein (TIGR02117 family)